ncbi:MAG: hypothetical protein KDK07_07835 [Bauldia sp.]|nr:hypothetical protein [Bauldia sp.]
MIAIACRVFAFAVLAAALFGTSEAGERTFFIDTGGYCGAWVFYGLSADHYKKCTTDGNGRYFNNCRVSVPYPGKYDLGIGGHGGFDLALDEKGNVSVASGVIRKGLNIDNGNARLTYVTKNITIYPNGINGRWGFEYDTPACDKKVHDSLIKTIVFGIQTFLTTTTAHTDILAEDSGGLRITNTGSFDVEGDHAIVFRTTKIVVVPDKPDRTWSLAELWFDGGSNTTNGAAEVTILSNSTVKIDIPGTGESGKLSLVGECYVLPRSLLIGTKPFGVYLPAAVCGRR